MRKELCFNNLGDSGVLCETEKIWGEYDAKRQDEIRHENWIP